MPSIAVKDFGPIAHADIDLKPLTVLIGPNNTGKSYLASALYSLFQTCARIRGHRHEKLRSRLSSGQLLSESPVERLRSAGIDSDHVRSEIQKFVMGENAVGRLPPAVRNWLQDESKQWAAVLAEGTEYQLQRCFGSRLGQLGRRTHQPEHRDLEIDLHDESSGLSWTMRCNGDKLSTVRWNPDTSNGNRSPTVQSDVSIVDANDAAEQLIELYLALLLRDYSAPSHYLPAGRSDIIRRYKTLASLVIGQASSAWIGSNDVERLPGVIADLMQALLVLDHTSPSSGAIENVVELLESKVVAGSVELKKGLVYPDIWYRSATGEFLMHQVSSTVSEIAPVILYLKYLIRPGHMFIFEEPESHLDPANQRLVAKAIAMLVNAGVHVLVTTHSDIFLQQINNLVQASGLESRKRLRMGYKATEVLKPSDLSAYVFHPGDGGTRVAALPIDSDYGISTESFDNVHSALYDEVIRMEHVR